MVRVMDRAGFGNCTNHFECRLACPKGISVENIARLNREYPRSLWVQRDSTEDGQT